MSLTSDTAHPPPGRGVQGEPHSQVREGQTSGAHLGGGGGGRPGLCPLAQGAPGRFGPARMTLTFFSPQVTHLLIERPPLFHYRPGDYLYLNVPSIALYEWHPFTISSAPEQKGTPPPLVLGMYLRGSAGCRAQAGNQEHGSEQDRRPEVTLQKLPLKPGSRCPHSYRVGRSGLDKLP